MPKTTAQKNATKIMQKCTDVAASAAAAASAKTMKLSIDIFRSQPFAHIILSM